LTFVRLICLVGLLLVGALVGGTIVPRPWSIVPDAEQPVHRILLLSNAIHTDIAVPLDEEVRGRFAMLRASRLPVDLPGVRYLVFGWGSRAFYIGTPTWSDLRPGPLLRALTWDRSVMHVSVAGALDESTESVRGFELTDADFERLLDFIDRSFHRGSDGPIPIPDAAYGDHDEFFEAEGRFTAALGCNSWAAAALREADLRTGWWTPLPQTLGLSLDIHNDSRAPGYVASGP
jgi:uncharacterized protein (TIGR02117 family)